MGKLMWLLGQVGPLEAAARVRLGVVKRLSRGWRARVPEGLERRRVFGAVDDGEVLREAFEAAGLTSGAVEEAARVLAGDFTLFGGVVHHVEGGIPDWLAAFPDGERWGEGFSFGIDISGRDGRDVRFTWELSRHGDLVALARAGFLTGERRYISRLEELIASWLEANAFLRGPNWMSALEVGIRGIAWAFIDDVVACGGGGAGILRGLWEHGAYLERFLSAGLNPSNHQIGEAAGLFVIGKKFGGYEAGRRWRARGRRILEREILRQTFGSGATREQSVNYHRFVAGLFAVCLAVSEEGEFSERFCERLRGMYGHLRRIARPDGSFADWGDSDNAVALRLSAEEARGLQADLALGEALFGDGDARSAEGLWLLGARRDKTRRGTGMCAGESVFIAGAGVAVLRSGEGKLQVEFDCGVQGYGAVSSHGHADALGMTLWRGGERLIDTGTYRYNGAAEWREAFRGSGFHNTVTVDGASQAEGAGPFRWLDIADARPEGHYFSGELDWADGVLGSGERRKWRHEREVLRLGADVVILLDRVVCGGRHEARGHFHVGAAEVALDGAVARVRYGDGEMMLAFAGGEGQVWESVCGGERDGWRSRLYGEKEESAALSAGVVFKDEAFMPWVLCFGEDARVEPLEVGFGEIVALSVLCAGGEFLVMCGRRRSAGGVRDIKFVGRWGVFELREGRVVKAWGADAWALEEEGRRLYTRFGGNEVGCIYGGD